MLIFPTDLLSQIFKLISIIYYKSSFHVIDLKLDIELSPVHCRRSACSAAACCATMRGGAVMSIYEEAAGRAYRSHIVE